MNFWNETDLAKIELLVRKMHSSDIARQDCRVFWISPFPFVVLFKRSKPQLLASCGPDQTYSKFGFCERTGIWLSAVSGLNTDTIFGVSYYEDTQSYYVRLEFAAPGLVGKNEVREWENLQAVRLAPLGKRMVF